MLAVKAGTWYEVPTQAGARTWQAGAPQEICDLVRLSAKASKVNRGDIMWCCWQPCGAGSKPHRATAISSGAMLIMCTPWGADTLAQIMDPKVKDGMQVNHFDVSLKNWLTKGNNASEAKACYLHPPLGNYSAHISGCDPSFAVGAGRPSCWNERWVCPGTRRSQDPQNREKWWCSMTAKGPPVYLGRADVDDASPNWMTLWRGQKPQPVPQAEHEAKTDRRRRRGKQATDAHRIEPAAILQGGLPAPPPPFGPPRPPNPVGPRPPSSRSAAQQWLDGPAEPASATEEETVKKTDRNDRFLRKVRQYRGMRSWVRLSTEAARCILRYNYYSAGCVVRLMSHVLVCTFVEVFIFAIPARCGRKIMFVCVARDSAPWYSALWRSSAQPVSSHT